MRRQSVRRIGPRALCAVCLAVQTGLLFLWSPVQAQTDVKVEVSVAPTLFASDTEATAILCFASIDTAAQTLDDGDTFTYLFDPSLGTIKSVGSISVSAETLSPANFSSAFTTTPTQQVIVTYHQISTIQDFKFGDTVCVDSSFEAGTTENVSKVSLVTRFNHLANGERPFSIVHVVKSQ
jgi:hypothetical protein